MINKDERLRALERIQKELEGDPNVIMYQGVSRTIDAIKAQPKADETEKPVEKSKPKRTKPRGRQQKRRPGHASLVFDMISESGRPLTAAELVAALEAAGSPVGGEKKTTNLSSVLSKDERFTSVMWPPSSHTRAWWLTDRPLPSPNVDDLLSSKESAFSVFARADSNVKTESD